MKKALTLLLSFVIVPTFAGCSFKYNVFQNIEQKSKRFKDVNLSVKSIEVLEENDEYGFTVVSATGEDFIFLIDYDSEEYKTSKRPKVLSMAALSKANSLSDDDKNDLFNACKSMLLIDEWNLNSDDIESLNKTGRSDIKTPDGEKLTVSIDFEIIGSISINTEEMRNRLYFEEEK